MMTPEDRARFACKCGCGFDTVDVDLHTLVRIVENEFGPITINSACRCREHNRLVKGSQGSQHTLGRAIDFYVPGTDIENVATWIEARHSDIGLGRYNNFLHIDTRGYRARWGADK